MTITIHHLPGAQMLYLKRYKLLLSNKLTLISSIYKPDFQHISNSILLLFQQKIQFLSNLNFSCKKRRSKDVCSDLDAS